MIQPALKAIPGEVFRRSDVGEDCTKLQAVIFIRKEQILLHTVVQHQVAIVVTEASTQVITKGARSQTA